MSFIAGKNGEGYAPGYFLAYNDENVVRETRQFAQDSDLVVTSDDGAKHIPGGTAYPSNDEYAIGLAYEDVDVSTGDMPGSVITGGAIVYENRLPVELDSDAKTALEALGFKFIEEPAVTRPWDVE